ncbi:MAG: hypothetical protein F4Y78_06560 [Candidatus Dadabacteria bacterium]|nr:hypothetical protein [Candidatus Dadabacteria bacterium]MYA47883.1 hypothetical protein [Candidatus Dadabacteria bacterium]MYF47789.1 hypothetical protein [Candidatus Dadabacteria bacterium]MYG82792.1 hypothetical protein [Candidatus Dadabacteria bacterium]
MKPEYQISIKKKKLNNPKWEKDREYSWSRAAEARARNLLREPGENGFPKWDKVAIVFVQPASSYMKSEKEKLG